MRKLTLNVEKLKVDSFETVDEDRARGTVRAHDTVETEWCTGYPDCISKGHQCQTPNDTCYGSCGCTNGCGTGVNDCW